MLVKHNNNSISDLTSAGQLPSDSLVLISSQTASGSASISFTSGIDSTYPIYRFEFINIHPATNNQEFRFQGSTNGGSSYGVTITSTFFQTYHDEANTSTSLAYNTNRDLAQSTSYQPIADTTGNGDDECASGMLTLYNPSSTTFVKHFMAVDNHYYNGTYSINDFSAGYFNTISSINAIQFKFASGNIDSGTIKLYGIKGD